MDLSRFETELSRHLDLLLSKTFSRTPPRLAESIRYGVLGTGKRLRPRLAFASGKMLGVPESVTLPVAIALELYHAFTLIHDDLPALDNDDLRRGKPSNHKEFGQAIAVLAGDGLLTLAIEEILSLQPRVSDHAILQATKRFLEAAGPRGVIGGQAMEFSPRGEKPSRSEIETLHTLKTARLFQTAVLMPYDLSELNEPKMEAILEELGLSLGLAFQIEDDCTDSAQDTGDRSSVWTVLAHESPAEARARAHTRVRNALRKLEIEAPETCFPLTQIAEGILRG